MQAPTYPINFVAGWLLVLAAFATGAVIGLSFHREDFLGGYNSFPRRLLRLGHIACAALGLMNVLFSIGPWPAPGSTLGTVASAAFIVGGVSMPVVCFLTAWRKPFRHIFAVPVTALFVGVIATLLGGHS
jgi:hypothetical protein